MQQRKWHEPMVEVWRIGVDTSAAALAWNLLNDLERQRLQRFHLEADRMRHSISRGALRAILSDRLGLKPSEVPIQIGVQGKPQLAGTSIEFNCSHAGHQVLIALSSRARVGVDIESLDRRVEYEPVLRQFGAASELTVFEATNPVERPLAFFHWWTRKEAYMKGLGCGLLGELRGVTTWSGSEAPLQVENWTINNLTVAEGYAAALAVEVESLPAEAIAIHGPEWLWK